MHLPQPLIMDHTVHITKGSWRSLCMELGKETCVVAKLGLTANSLSPMRRMRASSGAVCQLKWCPCKRARKSVKSYYEAEARKKPNISIFYFHTTFMRRQRRNQAHAALGRSKWKKKGKQKAKKKKKKDVH